MEENASQTRMYCDIDKIGSNHLNKRDCPSVRRSVGRSVGPSVGPSVHNQFYNHCFWAAAPVGDEVL